MIENGGLQNMCNMEFCGVSDLNKTKPKLVQVKEIPYAKKSAMGAETAGMSEKKKRIAELKKQLLAPKPMKKRGGGADKPDEMTDKFKRVMDWGTPRLVTKNRQICLDGAAKQESRNLLMKFAGARKGEVDHTPTEKKEEFTSVTVQNFRKKMLDEELGMENLEMIKRESKKLSKADPLQDNMKYRKSSVAPT